VRHEGRRAAPGRLQLGDVGPRCPADWEPRAGLLVGWPCEVSAGRAVRKAGFEYFTDEQYDELAGFVASVAAREPVTVVAAPEDAAACRRRLAQGGAEAEVLELGHVNWWIRDTGPTFVVQDPAGSSRDESLEGAGRSDLAAVCWDFHGYGPPQRDEGRKFFYGFYCAETIGWRAGSLLDAELGRSLARHMGVGACAPPQGMLAFEGGAVVCDGEGTGVVVEEILERTGMADRRRLEACLRCALGLRKILWLPYGLSPSSEGGNCHADMVAAFCGPGRLLLLAPHSSGDPDSERLQANFEALRGIVDARGRPLEVVPVPRAEVGWFERGVQRYNLLQRRWYAQSLERSYTNLVFSRGAVLVPQYGDEGSDERALNIVGEACSRGLSGDRGPPLEVVPVPWREVARLGGGLRCCSLPMPA